MSNPDISATDILNKLAQNENQHNQQIAILCLGMVGAGTNNARISDNLRNLAIQNQTNLETIYFIRIAQGLLYMSQGVMKLSVFYSENVLIDNKALAGLIIFCYSMLE